MKKYNKKNFTLTFKKTYYTWGHHLKKRDKNTLSTKTIFNIASIIVVNK